MELTGKCKEAFENWYVPQKRKNAVKTSSAWNSTIRYFLNLNLSMQFGVYQDFFKQNGILMNITLKETECSYYVTTTHKWYQSFLAKDETEVRKKSLKEANRWFNELK